MSTFGEDLIQSLNEALAHTKDEGPAIVHTPVTPREVRKQAKLTQAQMAALPTAPRFSRWVGMDTRWTQVRGWSFP